MVPKVFVSWSGGKDCCLACYKASLSGLEIGYLANMVTEDGRRSWTHGLSSELLRTQSQAIGVPLVQRRTKTGNYEAEFKDMLLALKREGVSGGVFGDIDLDEHREWVERVCREVAITPYQPLWGQSQETVLNEIIDAGFEAIIVSARADLFGEEWLGRRVDSAFIDYLKELSKTKGVTLCGETGEYHTLVIDGPIFDQRLEILESNKVLREERWFLDILRGELKPKS
jgi:diphthine-ammonia ligase